MSDDLTSNEKVKRVLEIHRADFQRVAGQPFEHFYCPILHEDAPASLQKGHVINESFKGAPGIWVVQRQDVDSFFGKNFEADFDAFVYAQGKPRRALFRDKKLYQHFRPRFFRGAERINYFLYEAGKAVPDGHQLIELPADDDSESVSLCVKISAEALKNPDPTKPFAWEWRRDFRIPAIPTLIKAAHLTMFRMFGYRYVMSEVGKYVGDYILGRFYREHKHKKKIAVVQAALTYFHEFRHMVRPIHFSNTAADGTLLDGGVYYCSSDTEPLWAMVIIVRTGDVTNAVLIPVPDNPLAMEKFRSFLASEDAESLEMMEGKFDSTREVWVATPPPQRCRWPKNPESYPEF